MELGEVPDLRAEEFPAALRLLGRPVNPDSDHWYCSHWSGAMRPHWFALLPERPELVAARLLRDVSEAAVHDQQGTAAAVLPHLADADGEAGEAVHLSVAYGLGARHAEDRLAAVDALLVLAARGRLEAGRLGADLGQLVRRGAVKPARLADAVRTAAATGRTPRCGRSCARCSPCCSPTSPPVAPRRPRPVGSVNCWPWRPSAPNGRANRALCRTCRGWRTAAVRHGW